MLTASTRHFDLTTTSSPSTLGAIQPDFPNILAISSLLRLGFLIILFFVGTSAILSSMSVRFGNRLFTQVRPAIFKLPFRPITTSTMAPKEFQKPPQAPPLFTASEKSLLEDAKAICGMSLSTIHATRHITDLFKTVRARSSIRS